MNFVAMDFETANGHADSACSIALVMVRDNQIVDEYYSLINPEEPFNPYNMKIHQIHPADVKDAPTFSQIWPDIKDLFQSNLLITAHNLRFDARVLQALADRYDFPRPHYLSIDTLQVSRKFHPDYENHKLNTVSQNLQIDLEHHHHALSDSIACAKILIDSVENYGEEQIKKLVKPIN